MLLLTCRRLLQQYPVRLHDSIVRSGGRNWPHLAVRHRSGTLLDSKRSEGVAEQHVTGETAVIPNSLKTTNSMCPKTFARSEDYLETFLPVAAAAPYQCEDIVYPTFLDVGGIVLVTIRNGYSILQQQRMVKIAGMTSAIGQTMYLIPVDSGVSSEEDYLQCHICHYPDANDVDSENDFVGLILDSPVYVDELQPDQGYYMQHPDSPPLVNLRNSKALITFSNQIKSTSPMLRQAIFAADAAPNPSDCGSSADGELTDVVEIPASVSKKLKLNMQQLLTVANVFKEPLTLISGPPGTGKTSVAAAIVQTALAHFRKHSKKLIEEKVLVCASSNNAADHLCAKLIECGIRVCRVATLSHTYSSVHPDVKPYCLETYLLDRLSLQQRDCYWRACNDRKSLCSLDFRIMGVVKSVEHEILRQYADVVVTTCSSSGDPRLDRFMFPLVVIDEVTQTYEPECLLPLVKGCSRAVLIGDPRQLGPVSSHYSGLCPSYFRSMYDRLILTGKRMEHLTIQYRMHPAIAKLVCTMFYDGRLVSGVSAADRTPTEPVFPWPNAKIPIAFLHHSGPHAPSGKSLWNESEVLKVTEVTRILCAGGVEPSNIGIITPYSAQRNALSALPALPESIVVRSIDAFQGREKDYIVVSCVRSSLVTEHPSVGFLKSAQRLNVMLTRARFGVILIGNIDFLSTDDLWLDLINRLRTMGCIIE